MTAPTTTAAAKLLAAVEANPGATTTELVDLAGVAASTASVQLRKLAEQGLIAKAGVGPKGAATWAPTQAAPIDDAPADDVPVVDVHADEQPASDEEVLAAIPAAIESGEWTEFDPAAAPAPADTADEAEQVTCPECLETRDECGCPRCPNCDLTLEGECECPADEEAPNGPTVTSGGVIVARTRHVDLTAGTEVREDGSWGDDDLRADPAPQPEKPARLDLAALAAAFTTGTRVTVYTAASRGQDVRHEDYRGIVEGHHLGKVRVSDPAQPGTYTRGEDPRDLAVLEPSAEDLAGEITDAEDDEHERRNREERAEVEADGGTVTLPSASKPVRRRAGSQKARSIATIGALTAEHARVLAAGGEWVEVLTAANASECRDHVWGIRHAEVPLWEGNFEVKRKGLVISVRYAA